MKVFVCLYAKAKRLSRQLNSWKSNNFFSFGKYTLNFFSQAFHFYAVFYAYDCLGRFGRILLYDSAIFRLQFYCCCALFVEKRREKLIQVHKHSGSATHVSVRVCVGIISSNCYECLFEGPFISSRAITIWTSGKKYAISSKRMECTT